MREINTKDGTAYECIDFENYFITKTGILYSIYIKGGNGSVNYNNPHKILYGTDKNGYYRVVLSYNGKHFYRKVHTLVARQFIGEIPKDKCVNHIDGNIHNNEYTNLEIITPLENTRHAWKTGLANKEQNPNRIPIDIFDNDKYITYHVGSIADCIKLTKFRWSYINKIKENKTPSFNECLLRKITTGISQTDYYIQCYFNGKLYKKFNNILEASIFFNKKRNTISESFSSNYPKKVNRYTISFPNVSTIESVIL